jgi:hypothetical protein
MLRAERLSHQDSVWIVDEARATARAVPHCSAPIAALRPISPPPGSSAPVVIATAGKPVPASWKISSIQQRLLSFTLLRCMAFTLQCIRAHGHRTWVLSVKAGRRFALRKVSPALGLAKPLPSLSSIKRGAVAAQ